MLNEMLNGLQIDDRGIKRWYLNDKLHRADGPAIELLNGSKCWYFHGKQHRVGGPAVEYASGDKIWYINGKRHREDGPAVELSSGDKKWFINGEQIKEEEFSKESISFIEEEQYCLSYSLSENEDYSLFAGETK